MNPDPHPFQAKYIFYEKAARSLLLFRDGIFPFFVKELQVCYGDNWERKVKPDIKTFSNSDTKIKWDPTAIFDIFLSNVHWNNVFAKKLGPKEKNLLFLVRDLRNEVVAHPDTCSYDAAYSLMQNIQNVLKLKEIDAVWETNQIELLKFEIKRVSFEEEYSELSVPQIRRVKDDTVSTEANETGIKKRTEKKDPRAVFLADLVFRLKESEPGLVKGVEPPQKPYWSFASGRKGFRYGWAFRPNGTIVTELYIDTKNPKEAFRKLLEKRSMLEQTFGEELKWDRNEGKGASRIFTEKLFRIEASNTNHEEAKQWALSTIKKLRQTFQNHLLELPQDI